MVKTDLISVEIPSASPLATALLHTTVFAADHGEAGTYQELPAIRSFTGLTSLVLVPQYEEPAASSFAKALLHTTVFAISQDAGVFFPAITVIDQTSPDNPFRIDGTSTRIWSFLDDTVLATFRIDGSGVRAWTMEETRTGELLIAGTGTRLWSGTELSAPEAFRIHGVGTRLWFRSSDTFRINGIGTRKWTMAIGIADECLTADGEAEGSPAADGYGMGLYGDDVYGDSEEGGEGGGKVKNYVF